jgi:3-deoxy-7-phosphoheptulonate synthase/chorismate mutase
VPRTLEELRREIERLNFELLERLSERARLALEAAAVKTRSALPMHDPRREGDQIARLVAANPGPFPDETVAELFREVFRASLNLQEAARASTLRVGPGPARVVRVAGRPLVAPFLIAGPCSVESEEQIDEVAAALAARGLWLMRGGTWKPRSSPYSFQGLGEAGLDLLVAAARRHGLATVTEVTDTRRVERIAAVADMLQVGARNMYNYDLLREVGRSGKPVLLKRSFGATIEELLHAAEYVALAGGGDIVLCERGIRTFARETRFTLDIAAIPLLRQLSCLPVVADVSHAAGRRDLVAPLARAALAAGAHDLMVEIHPRPEVARSDAQQQLPLGGLDEFLDAVGMRAPEGR